MTKTIRAKLTWLLASVCVMMLCVAGAGLYGLQETHAGLSEVYKDRTLVIRDITTIRDLLMDEHAAPLNAIRDPGHERLEALERTLTDDHGRIDHLWRAYAGRDLHGEERELADAFDSARRRFVDDGLDATVTALRDGRLREAEAAASARLTPQFDEALNRVDAIVGYELRAGQEKHEQEQTLFAGLRTMMVVAIGTAVAGAEAGGGLLIRRIVRPLGRAVTLADAIAKGDLTQDIEPGGDDETGRLLAAMRDMTSNLRALIGRIQEMSDTVAVETAHVAEGNTSLSQRTEEQAASLEETASSMEQMAATVRQSAESTSRANEFAGQARDAAEKGGEVIAEATGAMSELNTAADKVANIVGVIDELAFQTNLLALNAAVEAARAGERGRGFAVVASEVRSLAERSASSAREIKTLIETSVREIQNGTQLVEVSGATLTDIVGRVKAVSDIVRELAAAAEEQSAGIDQVSRAVAQLDEVTQQNAAMVEESAASSRTQADLAHLLRGLVAGYRTRADGDRDESTAGAA